MKRILFWMLIALSPMLIVSCSDKENEEPSVPTLDVAKSIVGTWLLSTSDADNWISYEITESSRVNVEIAQSGYYGTGTGYYSVENDKFSGSYTTDRKQTYYIDWFVTEIKPFEIALKIYDENTLVGNASLYRVLSNLEIEAGNSNRPDYRGFCGTNNVSNFAVLDNTIAKVDANSGEITGLKEGITFVTFTTPNGVGVLKVSVVGEIKTFPELLAGTWVYDNPSEKVCERYAYAENGYVSVQWTTNDDVYNFNESARGMYTIDGQTVSFTLSIDVGQMNMRMVTESINDFNWTYGAYDGSHYLGKYTAQRLLYSVTLSPEGTKLPDYHSLVGTAEIQSYKSHNETVATVNASGEITARSKGRTYIDVNTDKGSGVIEVYVDGGAIPVAFEDCVGKSANKVYELLGDKPYYEDETTIIYKNFTPDIDMIGVSLDSQTGFVNDLIVTYKSSVNTSQVTSILNATFIPYMSQTTDTFKAYMDTENREDASIGVTWDITELTLTYVNLATDLFTDYSVLVGMTKEQVLKRMGRDPDSSDEQSQNWFFFDNKGIKFVSAYYTDFVNIYDKVHSVATMLDDTLATEQVANYLKKKYPYYPEYSSDEDLVFIPEGHAMVIYYTPADNMIMYISTASSSKANSRIYANRLKMKAKSIKR